MRLRFHYESKKLFATNEQTLRSVRGKIGLVVLESQPQVRTIFCSCNVGVQRLAFPYRLDVVRYIKDNEKYIYPGIYGGGLNVFFRNNPMQEFTDKVFLSPTDMWRYGTVCTPHQYDNKVFSTLPELVNFVISIWWNLNHSIEYKTDPLWRHMTIEQALNYNWEGGSKFYDALVETKNSNLIKSEFFTRDDFNPPEYTSELVNKDWPPKPTESLSRHPIELLQEELKKTVLQFNEDVL